MTSGGGDPGSNGTGAHAENGEKMKHQRTVRHAKLREAIGKHTPPEIDVTQILSEEEQAELERQWEEQKAARALAAQTDRETLRARLKRTVERVAGDDPTVVS